MPVTGLQLDQNILLAMAQAEKIYLNFLEQYMGTGPKVRLEYGEEPAQENNAQQGLLELVEPGG